MKPKSFITLLAAVLLLQCAPNPVANGSGSTTETATVYNPGGSPAVNARVRFYPVNHNPRAGLAKIATTIDSATTDKNGNYAVTLDTGTYNMLVSGDSGLSYRDSITVTEDSAKVPPDTLGAPGSIRGRIRLQPGDDARTVFLLFIGTNTWGTPDDSTGRFTAANMAEGTYRVRILTTLDMYLPKDTVLSVTAGKTDTLPHDIVLQYTGIPVPSGLKLSYDTLRQIVTLTWNKPTTGRAIKGYNMYRKHADSTSFVKIAGVITDTVYKDSSAIQDQTYEYKVAAVDSQDNEGTKSQAANVVAVSAYTFVARFTYQDSSPINVFDIETDSGGNIYVLDKYKGDSSRVVKFTKSYLQDLTWPNMRVYGEPDLAIGDSGRLYLVNPSKGRIDILTEAGQIVDTIPNAGIFDNGINAGGKLDVANQKIYVLDVQGILRTFTIGGMLQDSVLLPYYGYFVAGNANDIYLTYAHEIIHISLNGTILSRWGTQGNSRGQFEYARQIDLTADSTLYVIDERNSRIQGFSTAGQLELVLSTVGHDDKSSTSYPGGVCAPSATVLLVGTDSYILVFRK